MNKQVMHEGRGGRWAAAWFVLAAVGWPAAGFAVGFRLVNQDPEATARGNAFAATADNPSAIYYNPAGIRQIEGREAQAGMHVIVVNSHYVSPAGETSDAKFEVQGVPQFYYVVTPEEKPYSFGLGCYAPYGLGLQWPDDAPLRTAGLEGRLMYTTVTPVAAYQVLPNLSIAAGPTLSFADLRMRRGLDETPGHDFQFRGHGWAAGAKAGIMWQPLQKWSVGLSYTSPTWVNFEGHSSAQPFVSGETSTSVEVPFPQFVLAGISYRPNTNWNIEVGTDWTDWDSLNTVTFKGTAFGDAPLGLNWETSWMANLGVTRYLGKGYWVAAGYFFSPNSTSDKDFTPTVPDTDLHVASVGFGHRGQRWSWALSGQFMAGPERHINNGTAADGTYTMVNEAINVSVGYRF